MATQRFEDLDRILSEIDTDHIPAEFVEAACITDEDDDVYVVTSEELEEIMDSPESLEEQGITEISLILNFNQVKETILHYSEIILKDIAV